MPILEITSQERRALRAAAHPLRPVVQIGEKGLTDAVLKEIETHLAAHGLIKVRVAGDDRDERQAMYTGICDALSCAAVQMLGKTLIIYRPSEKTQSILKPAPEPQTRAVRKASEPHVPKKKAASGMVAGSMPPKRRREQAEGEPGTGSRGAARKGAAPAPAARHGIPRRAGSALSLRAGARRRLKD